MEGLMDDQEREMVLYVIRTHEFTHAMRRHGCRGEYVYYPTEMWLLWPDFGYDVEHSYLLN
jgi:hypothetical protein